MIFLPFVKAWQIMTILLTFSFAFLPDPSTENGSQEKANFVLKKIP
jgi:hypothetical protein